MTTTTRFMDLPEPRPDWALFLDFDGSIVDIAPTPESVDVPETLPPLLAALREALGDAVAIVTGRPIAQIDGFLGAVVPAVAGLHGFERRAADGAVVRPSRPSRCPRNVHESLQAFAARHRGVFVEDKKFAVALHYRLDPSLMDACRDAVNAALAGETEDWQVVEGKFAFDVKPRAFTKGDAIEAFMREAPFRGRTPVFCGDDVTDEDGFAVVNARDGVSVRIGRGGEGPATRAAAQVDTVGELLDWLTRVAGAAAASAPAAGTRA